MKLAIDQVGDYVSVNDGRATTTYTVADFNEFLSAMRMAQVLIEQGRPNSRAFELYRSPEFLYVEYDKAPQVKSVPELHEALKDLFGE